MFSGKQILDIERCRRGRAQLHIEGVPRAALIEEAVRRIQADPDGALSREYLGVKNYAHFGDQRCDCAYGMGPSHGSIVFKIGRAGGQQNPLKRFDDDAIYYLEAYRDFGAIDLVEDNRQTVKMTLGRAIAEYDRLSARLNTITDAFARTVVEAHSNDEAQDAATSNA